MPTSTLPEIVREFFQTPGLLVRVYGDLAQPGVRQVGKALETVLGLGNTALWPLAWANERSRIALEHNLQKYRQQLEKTPIEDVVSVQPEVGVPIAEKFAYVSDETLSALYVALLAKASTADTVSEAHPSFVHVVNSLSPDEAKLFAYLAETGSVPFVNAIWRSPSPKPFLKGPYSFGEKWLVTPSVTGGLAFPDNFPVYVANFIGLGLVTTEHGYIHEHPDYESLKSLGAKKFPEETAPSPDTSLEFEEGSITVTEYGEKFMSACRRL